MTLIKLNPENCTRHYEGEKEKEESASHTKVCQNKNSRNTVMCKKED